MNNLRDLFAKEPALARGLILAIIGVLVTYGVPISEEQKEAITELLVVAAPLLLGLFIRGRVSPAQPAPVPELELESGEASMLDYPAPDPASRVEGLGPWTSPRN